MANNNNKNVKSSSMSHAQNQQQQQPQQPLNNLKNVEPSSSININNGNNNHHQQQHVLVFMNANNNLNNIEKAINPNQASLNNTRTTTSTVTQQTQTNNVVMMNTNTNNNKKHNIGFRLRRLFFGSTNPNHHNTASQTNSILTNKNNKVKADVQNSNSETTNSEFKISTKYNNPSLHSNSSESSSNNNNDKINDLKRKRNVIRKQTADSISNSNNNINSSSWTIQQQQQTSLLNQNVCPSTGVTLYECSICLLEQPIFHFPELKTCQHRACLSCLRQYLRIEICESRINITCIQCQELMHPNDIKSILKNDINLIGKYESFMVRRTLITDPDVRWCPAPDCDYCVIASGCASCPMLKCERPGCKTLFCYHCKQEWHPEQTCDQARAQRAINNKTVFIQSPNTGKSNVTFTSRGTDSFTQASTSSFIQRDDIKPCPCCKVLIIKMNDGSCNHMTCSVCGTEFCWLCMQKISDLHYLSPSGCTFWGKKPWSRKKKIMWQLGMLVGAPVGIALIAGIAVPAIIIGIPVWVGRKLYSRLERNHMSRHKSNFLVTAGVLTSIFVSPILAAVTVGIGVPILLAYVYGVVPISLCRSGGCGVSTSSSGVRIELDEDEINPPDGVSVDTALSGRGVTNPSIGEMSLGMSASLSIGSNSHLDRVVLDIQPDRENSSIAACAGSITSQYVANGQKKLETLVDINSNHQISKRYSLSSQNADSSSVTLSFGDRSVNTNASLIDEASSLKAQAGSFLEVASVSSNNQQPQQQNQSTSVEMETNKENKNIETAEQKTNQNDTNSVSIQIPNFILNKFESRSMEYLSQNYCNICHKSHKPCCPNFQHPNKNIKIENCGKNKFSATTNASASTTKSSQNQEYCKRKTSTSSSIAAPTILSKATDENKKQQISHTESKQKGNVQDDNLFYNKNRCSNGNPTPVLTKKALSQIFYPTSFNGNNRRDFDGTAAASGAATVKKDKNHHPNENGKISKTSLSHSVSFTYKPY